MTKIIDEAVGAPFSAGVAANVTPAALISWQNAVPRSSSWTRPTNAALPPSLLDDDEEDEDMVTGGNVTPR